jgi:site-specific DNA-methyltransferase (adenine-specific)
MSQPKSLLHEGVGAAPYYVQDGITLYHGRCEDVLRDMPPESVDLIITSPPYNLGNSTGGSFPAGKVYGKWSGSSLAGGYDEHRDNLPWPEYIAWQHAVLRECWRVLGPAGAIFYNHKARVQAGVLLHPQTFVPPELPIRQHIIWARAGGINAAPTHYCGTHELILVIAKPAFRLKSKGASMVGDVWRFPQQPNTDHPAPFPIELPSQAIETTGAQVVLDPFSGSGTTLRAAKDAGVRGVGIESSERWCEASVLRLGQQSLFGEAAA